MLYALEVLEIFKSMTEHHRPKHSVILNASCALIYTCQLLLKSCDCMETS